MKNWQFIDCKSVACKKCFHCKFCSDLLMLSCSTMPNACGRLAVLCKWRTLIGWRWGHPTILRNHEDWLQLYLACCQYSFYMLILARTCRSTGTHTPWLPILFNRSQNLCEFHFNRIRRLQWISWYTVGISHEHHGNGMCEWIQFIWLLCFIRHIQHRLVNKLPTLYQANVHTKDCDLQSWM